MKYLIKSQKIIPGLFLIVSLLSSCTKDFEKMNENPNNPVECSCNKYLHKCRTSILLAVRWADGFSIPILEYGASNGVKFSISTKTSICRVICLANFKESYINELKNLTIVINKATEGEESRLLRSCKGSEGMVHSCM